MKLSRLSKLLSGEVQAEEFLSDFERELDEYSRAMEVEGSSVSIDVFEDFRLVIGLMEVAKFCSLFSSGKLNAQQLAYLADAIQLCESVDIADEQVADIVAEFTDPEINGAFTRKRAMEIAAYIT